MQKVTYLWTLLDLFLEGVANRASKSACLSLGNELVVDLFVDICARTSAAALALFDGGFE